MFPAFPGFLATRRRLLAGLLPAPLPTGCFASGGDTSGSDCADGARLRVALAFPPAENFSPYGADATLLSRLGVTEGLTKLDANGSPAPALAESWSRENDRSWLFTLREASFQDGTEVTPAAGPRVGPPPRREPAVRRTRPLGGPRPRRRTRPARRTRGDGGGWGPVAAHVPLVRTATEARRRHHPLKAPR